jgi:hypothetical protein
MEAEASNVVFAMLFTTTTKLMFVPVADLRSIFVSVSLHPARPSLRFAVISMQSRMVYRVLTPNLGGRKWKNLGCA